MIGPQLHMKSTIAPAVDVPEMAAFAALEELRIARGQAFGAHVAEHAARNDAPGAGPEPLVRRFRLNVHRGVLRPLELYSI